ncbi:MAG: c-type cytochrome [Bacteriovoracaceae bacterium]|nr:c-type cytochrome [Bacteriovoracaceae bacterium]
MSESNKEPGMAYSMPKLHKIMAILSFIFLVTTLWVFLDDYMRPWKAYQVEALKIKRRHLDEQIKAAAKEIDSTKLAELNAKLKKVEEIVQSRKSDIESAEKDLKVIVTKFKDQTITNGILNGQVGAINFKYETSLSHKDPKAVTDKAFNKLQELKARFVKGKDSLKALQAEEKVIVTKITEYKKEVTRTEKEIKEITNKLNLLELAKKTTTIDPVFALRNLPFIDFLDPTIKIHQIVVNNVTDDRYFRHVPKVDRCITCHTFIDQPGYEKEVNPHKTHPRIDQMVGLESPHPMKQVGCTSCHGGEGHRVHDFRSAAHMPDTDKQKAEWITKYNWHEPHKIQQPMLTKSQSEASCVKCHSGVELIPGATVLNEGRMAIEKYGCNGCHKIDGWEHKRKTGPSLLKIAGKVDKEWFKSWVWEPKAFNKHTKMPAFFMQSNNSKPEFAKLNMAEVNAIAEYVWDKSKPYEANEKYTGGNAEKGKELISQVGCMGCHGVDGLEDNSKKVKAYAGPWLSGLGSKVKPDWLVSWLKKPWHYQEDTIMPSMRLSNQEANDIAAYLLGLRNVQFEDLKFAKLNLADQDRVLLDYYTAFDTVASAKEKLAKMDSREKTLELGKRSIGKYGCYSCHNVEGFDGLAGIGPELTKVGSKPAGQFGFGIHHDIPHRRDAWITAHLQRPAMWDDGIDKVFKDLNKMPNFYMSETEAKKITVALLGQVSDVIPLSGVKRLTASETMYHDGMKVVNKYGCTGCHQVDGLRGDVLNMYMDDINQGPPRLVGQGHRVQTDWFYNFLGNVQPIRPWLQIRMPSFNLSTEEKNRIVGGFQHGSKQPTFTEPAESVKWIPGEREETIKLWNALNCVSCHSGGFTNDVALAPNLHLASKRLRPTWIKKWLTNPQAILPGTSMPSFWGDDGKTPIETGYFGGDADKQVEALTKYVIELGQK